MRWTREYQGDVVKFAGDSLIVGFFAEENGRETRADDFSSTVVRAVTCGLKIIDDLGEMILLPRGEVMSESALRSKRKDFDRQLASTRNPRILNREGQATAPSVFCPAFRKMKSELSRTKTRFQEYLTRTGAFIKSKTQWPSTPGSHGISQFNLSIKVLLYRWCTKNERS